MRRERRWCPRCEAVVPSSKPVFGPHRCDACATETYWYAPNLAAALQETREWFRENVARKRKR